MASRFGDLSYRPGSPSPQRALSIRQPFAELILRGAKLAEYRSKPTRVIGERFWIYASKSGSRSGRGAGDAPTPWSNDLAVPGRDLPVDMLAIADALRLFPRDLPTGVIVGTAVIERVDPVDRVDAVTQLVLDRAKRDAPLRSSNGAVATAALFAWRLVDVQRLDEPFIPKGHPQPVWWRPG